jgi:AcrR family transcriptional regulator
MPARVRQLAREKDVAVVRPKASVRKSRSETVEHRPRRPLQDRSVQRFEAILTATEELLRNANIEDVSFYDIARQAKISPASINYLFPTMAALRIELNRRINRLMTENVEDTQRALAKMRNPSWQDWLLVTGKRVRDQLNANRAACEVLLGPLLHRESRRAAIQTNDEIGRSLLQGFRQVFSIPDIAGLAQKFALISEIADALWGRAYIANGHIDDESFDESIRVQIAYLRTVLPETLPLIRGGKLLAPSRRPARNP